MQETVLRFTRDYDLPRAIVWDALIDGDLVGGWLAPAVAKEFLRGEAHTITAESLELFSEALGEFDFDLFELEGGPRESSTRLTLALTVDTDPRLAAVTIADWQTNLEQLDRLLHGHPIDWDSWDQEFGEIWRRFRDLAQHRRARS